MQARQAGIAATITFLTMAALPVLASPTLLFEPATGKVLYAEDIDDVWYPASLTKLTTVYVTFEAIKEGKLKLDDKIPCSLVATLQPPSKAGLKVGDTLTVEQALEAVIIKSANDVTVMLAEAVSGSETAFIARMNETAKRLGMTKTNFVNTNGLPDPGQLSSARDLAKISRAVVQDYPQYANYWAMPDMRIGRRRLGSHNALLRTFAGADGLKTGFTCDSGYNVVASATRDGRRLMAVVLGESSGNERAVRAATLLEYGFQTYAWKDLLTSANLDTLPVDPAAKNISSVRSTVTAWGCGGHRRHQGVAHRKAKSGKLAAKSKKKVDGSTVENAQSADPGRAAEHAAPKPNPPKAADATAQ